MSRYVVAVPSTGEILSIVQVGEDVVVIGAAEADSSTHYISEGVLTARPTLPDLPTTAAVDDVISVGGFPIEAVVTVSLDGLPVATGEISETGHLELTADDAGVWTVEVSEVFPTQGRSYTITVS